MNQLLRIWRRSVLRRVFRVCGRRAVVELVFLVVLLIWLVEVLVAGLASMLP